MTVKGIPYFEATSKDFGVKMAIYIGKFEDG